MLYLVKLFPEITIKSRPVRKRFIRQLRKNLKSVLKEIDQDIKVRGEWDCMEVQASTSDPQINKQLIERLACVPGITQFLEVDSYELPDLDGILELALQYYGDKLEGKTFAVRCKRMGKHSFNSVDVERFVGAGLNKDCGALKVNLRNPDVTVALEIRDENLYMVKEVHLGLGGFPLGCQDSVLSLISGGFDSAVSSYLCIKRGLQTHYLFFNLGGRAHELAVKELALFLWMKYHGSHRVKFITVPFENVVTEILDKVEDSQMGVILKRMMVRAADKVADHMHIKAIATGESIAQVSSQTLVNLSVIDSVAEHLVLRPLSTSNKQDIIDLARDIGSEDFSKNIPEYCAVISKNPTTKAKPERIERQEGNFDFAILDAAVEKANYQLITDVMNDSVTNTSEVPIARAVNGADRVIDIRHPDEIDIAPLPGSLASDDALAIPFYSLQQEFPKLDNSLNYLLYCDRGMMSRLHAAHLMDEGHSNVAVLDLKSEPVGQD